MTSVGQLGEKQLFSLQYLEHCGKAMNCEGSELIVQAERLDIHHALICAQWQFSLELQNPLFALRSFAANCSFSPAAFQAAWQFCSRHLRHMLNDNKYQHLRLLQQTFMPEWKILQGSHHWIWSYHYNITIWQGNKCLFCSIVSHIVCIVNAKTCIQFLLSLTQ